MHLYHRYVLFRNMLIRTHKLISAIWKLDHSYSLIVLLICNLIGSVTGIGIYDLNVSLCLRFLLFSNQSELQRPLPLWANDEYRDLIFWKYQCCPPPRTTVLCSSKSEVQETAREINVQSELISKCLPDRQSVALAMSHWLPWNSVYRVLELKYWSKLKN